MNKLIRLYIFCIALIIGVQTLAAERVIQIEVKEFSHDIVFVFHRDRDQIVNITNKGKNIAVGVNMPSTFRLLNPEKFNRYATGLSMAGKKQFVSFSVLGDLQFSSMINGENFEAIKFRSKDSSNTDDLASLSAANNDPGAVKYKHKGNEHFLAFGLGGEDSGASAFFRGKYLWVVFDKQRIFSFKNQGIFSDFELIQSDSGTVLRLKVQEGFGHAKTVKTDYGWGVVVSNREQKTENKVVLKAEDLSGSESGKIIKGDFSDSELVAFQDPEVGDNLRVITFKKTGISLDSASESLEFDVPKTVQGLAVVLHSDDVNLQKLPDQVKIMSAGADLEEISISGKDFPNDIQELLELPTILPYLDKNLDILNFNYQKSRLISEAAQVEEKGKKRFDKYLELARFFFVNQWYQESLDALKIAKESSLEDFETNLQARFLWAVNHTMTRDYDKAKEEYDALLGYEDVAKIPEINLWAKYNNFGIGSSTAAIGFLDNASKSINFYANDKYWSLLFAEIELGLVAGDLKLVEKLLKDRRDSGTDNPNFFSLKFYQAECYRKKKQTNLAKQLYREVVYNEKVDPFNLARARFALVKVELQDQEIELKEAIKDLRELNFVWRGDKLEYEILMYLAGCYKDNGDILNSLRTYQYIQSAFNNKISNFYITSEMAKIFNEVFLNGGLGEKMDDFSAVALFYEFKELNPIGEQGDDVIIAIARRLVKLDLLENAAELLRHQIKYRLKAAKRVINADNLAVILMMDKNPTEAISVLDDTDKDNFNFKEHQNRLRLKARALIDLEKYKEALDYLKDDDSVDAEIIRREALFRGQNWSGYIDKAGADVDGLIDKLSQKDPAARQDLLRLAISYYLLNQQSELVALKSKVADKDKMLKDTIELLAMSSGNVDYRNIDKSLNIDQMKNLLDKYKNQFLEN